MTGLTMFTSLGASEKVAMTPEGGLAVRLINKTGAASVKGTTVHSSGANDGSVIKTEIDVPDCIGAIYEDGVADGSEVWVVVAGIAQVYFVDSATHGQLARTFVTGEANYVTGQAMAENVPVNPFSDAKHFCEIGHVIESRTGAGLAKVVLHFN